MTKDMMLARIAAILSTLNETDGSPESMLYIFCEMKMDEYQMIRDVLTRAKFVTIKGNYVRLTEAGKETARKVNEHARSLGEKI